MIWSGALLGLQAAAAVEGYFRQSMVSGFPVQVVDMSTQDGREAVATVASNVLPQRMHFSSLRENQRLCNLSNIVGWKGPDLQKGLRPPAEIVAAWVRSSATLRSTAGTCPQAAMFMLLVHVQNALNTADRTDLHEAIRLHLQYQCLKDWLLNRVFAGVPWQLVLADWPITEFEAELFRVYQRVLASSFNEFFDTSTPSGTGSALSMDQEPAVGFYQECPEAVGASHIRVFAGPDTEVVEGPVPVGIKMVGNALSLYWQARGLAILTGAEFRAVGGLAGRQFVRHLPRSSQAAAANATALRDSCVVCRKPSHWRWPHLCLGAWARIQGTVRAGMQAALRASGAEAAARALLRPSDVAVHFRCLPFFSDDYPLAAFSLLSALATATRILLVAGTLGPSCIAAAAALEAHVARRFPRAQVVRKFNTTTKPGIMAETSLAEDAELDFAILAFAPVLVRAAPSSFSLWAALAKEDGVVLSAPNPQGSQWEWETADFGWVWVRAPLLTSEVIKRHGFVFEQPEPWIRWLESH